MTPWPKCSICDKEISIGQIFVKVGQTTHSIVLAHDDCIPENKSRARRMNDARAWAVQEYTGLNYPASASG